MLENQKYFYKFFEKIKNSMRKFRSSVFADIKVEQPHQNFFLLYECMQ